MPTFLANAALTSPQVAWYSFKATAISSTLAPNSNWTVTTSSTGTGGVYAQSGDVITGPSSLGDQSWFVLKGHGIVDGGVVYYRQLCFQFDMSGNVRITYSPRNGFTSAASTTLAPSATDQQILYGSGTNAAPTYLQLWPTSGAWLQARFSESDDAFLMFSYTVGGSYPTAMFYLEVIPPLYVIGGTLIDHDPAVLYARAGSNCALKTDLASELRGPMGELSFLSQTGADLWCRQAAAYRAVTDASENAQPTIPGGMTSQPSPYYTVPTYPQDTLYYGRRTALAGVTEPGDVGNVNTTGAKGQGITLRWSGQLFAVPALVSVSNVSTGGLTVGTIIGTAGIFLPWECGISPAL